MNNETVVVTTITRVISVCVVLYAIVVQLFPSPALDRGRVERLATDYVRTHRRSKASTTSPPTTQQLPLTGVTVVITGATSGIGKSLAHTLHGLGATVVAVGRSPQKLARLATELSSPSRLVTVQAQLDDLASVSRAADEINSRYAATGIDFLINNAGVHYGSDVYRSSVSPDRVTSSQGYDLVWAVNYLSHFLLTAKLWPLLEKTSGSGLQLQHARVVQISSSYHYGSDGADLLGSPPPASVPRPRNYVHKHRSYATSKLAQLYHARALQRRAAASASSVRLVSVCPAWVATEIGGVWTRFLEYMGAFNVHEAGISSALDAMFLPELSNGDNAGDYVTQGNLPFPKFAYVMLPPLLRDVFIDGMAGVLMMTQRFLFRTGCVQLSSFESYDETIQESLYQWSEEQVKPWL